MTKTRPPMSSTTLPVSSPAATSNAAATKRVGHRRRTSMKSTERLPSVVPVYEDMLKRDRSWAMDEGDRHFQRDDAVFKTLRKIARRLESVGVPYAIAGGMALEAHGFRRLTVDVDILVNREGLKTIHEQLEGLGYLPPF